MKPVPRSGPNLRWQLAEIEGFLREAGTTLILPDNLSRLEVFLKSLANLTQAHCEFQDKWGGNVRSPEEPVDLPLFEVPQRRWSEDPQEAIVAGFAMLEESWFRSTPQEEQYFHRLVATNVQARPGRSVCSNCSRDLGLVSLRRGDPRCAACRYTAKLMEPPIVGSFPKTLRTRLEELGVYGAVRAIQRPRTDTEYRLDGGG